MKRHQCKYWRPSAAGWRNTRWCDFCGRRQYVVRRGDQRRWETEMTLPQFGFRWLPAVSGTTPERMLKVDVAFPFEFNSYESWDTCWRVTFALPAVRTELITPAHVMNGWRSSWHTCWVRIDAEAEAEFERRTGHPLEPGDTCYGAMRDFIQSTPPPVVPKPPDLHVVE